MKRFIIAVLMIIFIIVLFAYFSPKQDYAAEEKSVAEAKQSLADSDEGCIILNYHLINDDSFFSNIYYQIFGYNYAQQYNVSKQAFAEQMQFLNDNDIDVLSTEELQKHMQNNTVPNSCVTITFDDIDTTVYDNAFPILQKYSYPFTTFIITSKLPPNSGLTQESAENIKKMYDSGLETVGLHTDKMHNPDPETHQPIFLNPRMNDEFDTDTKNSIKKYEEVFGTKPKYFAYPHGFGTGDTDKILLDNGFEQLFTLGDGSVTNQTSDTFMPRVLITESNFDVVADWLIEHKN